MDLCFGAYSQFQVPAMHHLQNIEPFVNRESVATCPLQRFLELIRFQVALVEETPMDQAALEFLRAGGLVYP